MRLRDFVAHRLWDFGARSPRFGPRRVPLGSQSFLKQWDSRNVTTFDQRRQYPKLFGRRQLNQISKFDRRWLVVFVQGHRCRIPFRNVFTSRQLQ